MPLVSHECINTSKKNKQMIMIRHYCTFKTTQSKSVSKQCHKQQQNPTASAYHYQHNISNLNASQILPITTQTKPKSSSLRTTDRYFHV